VIGRKLIGHTTALPMTPVGTKTRSTVPFGHHSQMPVKIQIGYPIHVPKNVATTTLTVPTTSYTANQVRIIPITVMKRVAFVKVKRITEMIANTLVLRLAVTQTQRREEWQSIAENLVNSALVQRSSTSHQ